MYVLNTIQKYDPLLNYFSIKKSNFQHIAFCIFEMFRDNDTTNNIQDTNIVLLS